MAFLVLYRRGALEMFEIEEERQSVENAERERRVKEALDEIKRNGAGNLSRSEILMAARTLELQHKIDAAIERRNKRNEVSRITKGYIFTCNWLQHNPLEYTISR